MPAERSNAHDVMQTSSRSARSIEERNTKAPSGFYQLRSADGEIKQSGVFYNLITDVGDQWAMESAHGIGAPDALTGMRLGTGGDGTAAAKNGAGAALVGTYVTGSAQAFDTGPTGSDLGAGAGYRVSYSVTWAAGEATANDIDEVVITNENPLTDIASDASTTIARAILDPVVNKAAGDELTITWRHDHNGA